MITIVVVSLLLLTLLPILLRWAYLEADSRNVNSSSEAVIV